MRIGCCELVKLDMEQLFCAIIRSYRATAITWLASRLLFFSTILPHTSPFVLKRGYISPASRVSLGPFEKKQSAHYREKVTAFFRLIRIYRLGNP